MKKADIKIKENLFWNKKIEDLLSLLQVTSQGLTTEEVEARRDIYGSNTIKEAPRRLWLQFLARFKNPLIILLLVASAFSALTHDKISFIIIFTIILLSVVLDFFQQVRAERTIDKLRQSVAVTASVVRNGKMIELLVSELVPGDRVTLSPGDLVPADGRLLDSKDLYINQAILTGECYPVEKLKIELETATTDITHAKNSVFMGTSVISGSGMMLVIDTGKNTRLGQLATAITLAPSQNDFEKGIEKFGILIVRIATVMVLFVILVNIALERPLLETFLFALALAVGLTPELLPMITTITLAQGAERMAKQRVIVKRLPAMHNLGAMNILCTDKTGTLTEAKIRFLKTCNINGDESERVFLLAYINSFFETGIKSPLDQAILENHQADITTWKKIDEVPFDFERRRVSVLVENKGKRYLIVKGAPEDVLYLSEHYESPQGEIIKFDKKTIEEKCYKQFENLGEEGLRVLAVAMREVEPTLNSAVVTDETDLVFIGFVAFLDPPKQSAAQALHLLEEAGVKVKIITGDNERVTRYICKVLGLPEINILTGDDLAELTDEALAIKAESVDAFCRITPQQKSRIITALAAQGKTVGFLGDGINDAAAMHIADVGISVKTATDVAKEAADIILLEEDLAVIHHGVIAGRRAVVNTQKYIFMGGSSNFGNMFSMAGAPLILPFLPMLPIQILLNNLLYNFSQTVLPLDNVDKNMLDKPLRWDIQKIKRFMWVMGPLSSIFDYLTFYVLLHICNRNEIIFHTGWFIESILTQVLIIFAIRTRYPMFSSRPSLILVVIALMVCVFAILLPFTPLGTWFGFTLLPAIFYYYLIGVIIAYFSLVECVKYKFRNYLYFS